MSPRSQAQRRADRRYEEKGRKTVSVTLRLDPDLVKEIDARRSTSMSRPAFIVDLIKTQLESRNGI